jgi:hypothetical protein
MLYADGKVVTPLWKAKPGDTRLDTTTGEMRPLRFEADAALHVTGSGEPAWGTKHVMVAARHADRHARMILSIASVSEVGGEAKVALECIGRLAPRLPGALGVIYDGAFRGMHLVELLRDRGLLPVVPVTAASGGRHAKKPRVERTVLVGPGTIRHADGTSRDCILYAEAGALCLGELTTAARSTAPSTSGPSHPPTPSTNGSTPAARMPSRSTGRSTTAAGSDAPTPRDATASSSTSSATPSPSTASPCTDTGGPRHHGACSPRRPDPAALARRLRRGAAHRGASKGAAAGLAKYSLTERAAVMGSFGG